MKCNQCGAENSGNDKFCRNCGESLIQPENTNDFSQTTFYEPRKNFEQEGVMEEKVYRKENNTLKRFLVIGGGVFLIFIMVFSFFFFQKKSNLKKMEKAAAEYENSGDYNLAMTEYEKLYSLSNQDKYREKRDAMLQYETYQKYITEAETFVRGSNYRGAISSYLKVPAEATDLYSVSQARIDDLVTKVSNEINGILLSNDYDSAKNALKDYLNLLPDNPAFKDLSEKIDTERLASKEAQLEQQKLDLAAAQEKAKKLERQLVSANHLVGSWQYVTSGEANVRSGPGLNYSILYSLRRGDAVYIIDTYATSERVWCNIGDGWISYRTLNGEI